MTTADDSILSRRYTYLDPIPTTTTTTTTTQLNATNTYLHPSQNIAKIRQITNNSNLTNPPPPPTSIVTWNSQAGLGKQYINNPNHGKLKHKTLLQVITDHDISTLQETHGQPHDIIALRSDLQDNHYLITSQAQPHTQGGLLTCIHKQWLPPHHDIWSTIIAPGRILITHIVTTTSMNAIVNLHHPP